MDTNGGTMNGVGRDGAPDTLSASQYLQDKLLERRAKNMRPKRVRQSDFGPRNGRDDDIFFNEAEESRRGGSRAFDSSPLTAGSRRGSEMGESNGRKRAPGARDLNEQMDRLTKQNFALKLELDHRRESTTKLQEQIESMRMQVERAEQLEQEHAELLRINSQLVEELEKRDKAVEEAMDIICDLEDKVADMEDRRSATRPSTANADSGYAGTETHEPVPPSSPPEPISHPKTPHVKQRQPPPAASAAATKLLGAVNGPTPARPRREPHILSQKKPSTHALRSVYLETSQALHPVQSFNSLLTRRESKLEDEEAVLDSPRLSVLSESSFPSIYSPKEQTSPDKCAWEGDADDMTVSPHGPSAHLRQDSIKRVSQWMEERDQVTDTPSKSNHISPPISQFAGLDLQPSSPIKRPVDTAQFQSLAKTLSNDTATTSKSSDSMQNGVSYIKPFPIRTERQLQPMKESRPTSFAGPMFGEPLLPPTPDSASTRMLRASRSSIANDDRSLLDTTPIPVKGYDALEPNVRTAPRQFRSSVELHSAYESFVQRQNDEAYEGVDEEDEVEERPETARGLGGDYDFPDGSSLIMGTPSRFLKHVQSPSPLTTTNATDFASTKATRFEPRRRQSSSEVTASTRKPSMTRAETSPVVIPTYGNNAKAERLSSNGSVASPRSQHSGSSNHTVVQTIEETRSISPDFSHTRSNLSHSMTSPTTSRSRTSPPPARTLSQKTQSFFSRMSNTNTNNPRDDPRPNETRQREKSPLPTLTSTPSSAYINDVPKEARRPGTSQSNDINRALQATPRPPSSREGRRPSMPGRNNTVPAPLSGRRGSEVGEGERKNLFARRGSVKAGVDAVCAAPMAANGISGVGQEGGSGSGSGSGGGTGRMGLQRRRGSIREAVGSAARRPWR
ncbi:uncharacterized protein LTR77_001112 [Saxophila tyrrhenica]|uniref:Centrosomin N-terminal motif 1 domain-containing protein n=1 Tax=Saxophila tyrrhenica TaxID=1690608 RepID=A0AAV9PL60_9PEZI|nr:hypothetical protein LTR77_001112 [Saxophila tyrrhenica]